MIERSTPSTSGDERAVLTGLLRWHRETLARKCEGLSTEQLKRASAPPSELTLLGLLRHMAEVERRWFSGVVEGRPREPHWPGEDPNFNTDVTNADVGDVFAVWRDECARATEIAAATSLDATFTDGTTDFNLRYVLAHMIAEYARHNGHADLLRERVDGHTGVLWTCVTCAGVITCRV